MKKTGKIFVVSAPSGAGKTTLLNHLKDTVPDMVYSISTTTRMPREGEIDGVHYSFISEDEFRRRISRDEFAEWQIVHGNYYGTPKAFVDRIVGSGKHIIMDIDVYGKKKFDTVYPEAVGILILPPSLEVLEKRLRGRKSDSEETIALRLHNAGKEMEFAAAEGKYEYRIFNDDLRVARNELVSIVRNEISSGGERACN
ncbi:MAG: guanylate kinase [Chitinivibrionales bacterium]|nr:guanylate kinase [Chitinivibrionales bacterium]